jgi:hypothetical protein
MQSQGGRETAGSSFPASGSPEGRSSSGAILTDADRRVYEHVRPSREVWALWLAARRTTADPSSEWYGWPLHVAVVLQAWETAAADVRGTSAALDEAIARTRDARERRGRRARAYRTLLSEAGRTWSTVSVALGEYTDAADRAIGAAVNLQRAQLAHARALWWAEALMRSDLLAGALVHMRVGRRALESGASEDWHAEPPVELPPPPPAPPPPAVKPVPKKRGPFGVLRQTTGAWILIDERRPMGDREVFRSPWLVECNAELDLRADAEGVPRGDG